MLILSARNTLNLALGRNTCGWLWAGAATCLHRGCPAGIGFGRPGGPSKEVG